MITVAALAILQFFALPAEAGGPWALGPPRTQDMRTVCVTSVEPGSLWRLRVEWTDVYGVKHKRSAFSNANRYGMACETWLTAPEIRGVGYRHEATELLEGETIEVGP